jgi:hypothetical protein
MVFSQLYFLSLVVAFDVSVAIFLLQPREFDLFSGAYLIKLSASLVPSDSEWLDLGVTPC